MRQFYKILVKLKITDLRRLYWKVNFRYVGGIIMILAMLQLTLGIYDYLEVLVCIAIGLCMLETLRYRE